MLLRYHLNIRQTLNTILSKVRKEGIKRFINPLFLKNPVCEVPGFYLAVDGCFHLGFRI